MTDDRDNDEIVKLRRHRERPLQKSYSDAEKEVRADVRAAWMRYWTKRAIKPLVTDYVDLHDAVYSVEDTILDVLIFELVAFARADNVTALSLLQMVAGNIKMLTPEDVDVAREIPGELLVGECGYGLGYALTSRRCGYRRRTGWTFS